MSNIIKLQSDIPVVLPGKTINFTARVIDSESGEGVSGVTVTWTFKPTDSGATLGSETSTTSDTGYASNSVTCDQKAALVITGKIGTEDDSSSDDLKVGFSSESLPQPVVPQAHDGVLDEHAVNGLVQARVLRHTDDPESGDQYDFFWGKVSATQFDDGTSDTFPWVLNIKKQFTPSDVLSDGHYTVYYTVTDIAGNVTYSIPLPITVTGGTFVNPIFEAPQFKLQPDNIINWESVLPPEGVEVTVTNPQEDIPIYPRNVITLYMKVFDKDYNNEIIATKIVATYTVQEDDDGKNIVFYLPSDEITDDKNTFDDVRGQFWYTITGDGSASVSGSSFTKSMIIDTVPPHFKG